MRDAPTRLAVIRNPFDRRERDDRVVTFDSPPCVDALVGEYLPAGVEFAVSVNGRVLPREAWAATRITEGDQLVAVPVLHGGGGGLLGSVLSLGLMVVAPGIGEALVSWGLEAGLLGTATFSFAQMATVAGWGVSLVGSQLIGAMTAPSKQNLPAAATLQSYDNSPTYSWNPVTTQEPGGPIARAYGRIKLRGNVIGGWIENTGDTGRQQMAHLLIDLGMGPYNALSEFRLNDQPLSYYTDVTVTSRLGLLNQTVIGDFEDTRVTRSIGAKIVAGAPVTRTTAGSDYDALDVVLACPQGLWHQNDQGGMDTLTVTVAAEISPDGVSWSPLSDVVLSGNSPQAIRKTVRINGLARGTQYSVRVTNLSPDQTTSRYSDDTYLAEINEVMYDDFTYPRTVLVGVQALATDQISGGFRFECLAEAAIVRVWNGSAWSSVWSRNPAWVCWDILTQPVFDNALTVVRYDGFDPSRLDLTAFYAWAQFCDEMVPDGRGGTEARCLFDDVWDTPTDMWSAALAVMASARAVPVMRGTTISVVWDAVRTEPAQMFSVGNTSISGFRLTYLPLQDRAASIEIGYLNGEDDYQRDQVVIVNTAISEASAQRVGLALRGVTRVSQAWREGDYRLARNQYLKVSAELSVDIDALACTVGDLVWVQTDSTQWGVGGRIVSGTTTTLALDQSVTLDSGKSYEVRLRLADDTIVTRTITTAAGAVSSITVGTDFPASPSPYDPYAIGEVGRAVKEFVVMSVSRDGEQRAKLGLIEYNASVVNRDSGIPAIPSIRVSSATAFATLVVAGIEETLVAAVGGIVARLTLQLTLTDSSNHAATRLYRQEADGSLTLVDRSETNLVRVDGATEGSVVTLWLAAENRLGQVQSRAKWVKVEHLVEGKLSPPADVTGFAINVLSDVAHLSWDASAELDVSHARLRFAPVLSGAGWSSAVDLVAKIGAPATSIAVPAMAGTYLIKWVDSGDRESANAALIVTDVGGLIGFNVVEQVDEAPGFDGTHDSTVAFDGTLRLDSVDTLSDWTTLAAVPLLASGINGISPAGVYTFAQSVDLGAVYVSRVSADFHLSASRLTNVMASWPTLASVINLSGTEATDCSARIEVRTTADDPGGTPTWSAWVPLVIGDISARAFQFRATLSSSDPAVMPILDILSVTIDMPDRVAGANNIACPAGGLTVTFTPAFRARPAIATSIENLATGDYAVISNQSASGFDVIIKNSAGTGVARTFDWVAKGYGSRT